MVDGVMILDTRKPAFGVINLLMLLYLYMTVFSVKFWQCGIYETPRYACFNGFLDTSRPPKSA
ncbi:hypothetical protein NHJ13734_007376 [Beauveria thailandica]